MFKVVVAITVLLIVALCKKIPRIGGSIHIALLLAGVAAMLCSGIFNPAQWVVAWIDGLNRLAWISCLALAGAIFAEISLHLGTVDTIIGALKAKFGSHPRILVVCIMFVLCIAGSLLGDSSAAATVVGILTFGILVSMDISFEKISAIVMMGASVGSIMPPMTQAVALSSTLCNTDPDPVVTWAYLTSGIAFVVSALYCAFILVKKENVPGRNAEVEIKFAGEKAGDILRKNWKSLIPMFFLIIVVLMRTIPSIKIDLGPLILKNINFITIAGESKSLYDLLNGMTIITGLTNGIVLSIICAIIFAFCLFPKLRKNGGSIMSGAAKKAAPCVTVQLCCAFMLGAFYATGLIDAVADFAMGLNTHLLKFGGAGALMLIGMLTGSQSTAQNAIFSFFGPALIATGVNPTYAAVAGANLAAAGQGMPPADLLTFVICGMISAQYGKKVDPLKSMFYSMPMCIVFMIMGLIFLYI